VSGKGIRKDAIEVGHGLREAEVAERCHRRIVDAAGNDAIVGAEVRCHIDGYAVIAHPTANANPDGSDLGVSAAVLVGDPDTGSPVAAIGGDAQPSQGIDNPILQATHERPHIATAPRQIEHYVRDPLAGPVIGNAAAAAGANHRDVARIEEFVIAGARPRCEHRRVLQKPDGFRRGTGADHGDPDLHDRDGCRIVHQVL